MASELKGEETNNQSTKDETAASARFASLPKGEESVLCRGVTDRLLHVIMTRRNCRFPELHSHLCGSVVDSPKGSSSSWSARHVPS